MFFKKLLQTSLDLALTPVEIIKDVATLGGSLTDQDEPYTVQRLKKAQQHVEDVYNSLDD